MSECRTNQVTHNGNSGVCVAFTSHDELTEWAAAQQNGTEAYYQHTQEAPQMCGVSNRLTSEAKVELTEGDVADHSGNDDGDEADEQFPVFEENNVTDTGNHAESGFLSQSANDEAGSQSDDNSYVFGARAAFGSNEQSRNSQAQYEQTNQCNWECEAFCFVYGVGTFQVEAFVQEEDTYQNTAGEADESDHCVQVTAADTEDHTQWAAQEYQSADHNECCDDEAGEWCGAAFRGELFGNQSHTHCADYQTNDLRTEVLNNSGSVQLGGTSDVTEEASDAEAHVARVAQLNQQRGDEANYRTGNDDAANAGKQTGFVFCHNTHLFSVKDFLAGCPVYPAA